MVGTIFGIFVAYKYNFPNIRKLVDSDMAMFKHLE